MSNPRPRGKKEPSCLWAVEIKDTAALEKAVGADEIPPDPDRQELMLEAYAREILRQQATPEGATWAKAFLTGRPEKGGYTRLIDTLKADAEESVLLIRFKRKAPLEELVRDFRILITRERYSRNEEDGIREEHIVRAAVEKIRAPLLVSTMKAAIKVATQLGGEIRPQDIMTWATDLPWPNAQEVVDILGPPWTVRRVRKILQAIKPLAEEANRRGAARLPKVLPRML